MTWWEKARFQGPTGVSLAGLFEEKAPAADLGEPMAYSAVVAEVARPGFPELVDLEPKRSRRMLRAYIGEVARWVSRGAWARSGTLCGTCFESRSEVTVVAMSASQARREFFPLVRRVNEDRIAVEVTSKWGNAVLISAEEFAAWQETVHLLRSPRNAQRLHEAMASDELLVRDLDRA